MTTRIRNLLSTSIAALAVSIGACAALTASDALAKGQRSFGGMSSHGGFSRGPANIGRSMPTMNRGMASAATRSMKMPHAGKSVMNRKVAPQVKPQATTRGTGQHATQNQHPRFASAKKHEAAMTKEGLARTKPNQVTDNRVDQRPVREKSTVPTQHGGERRDHRSNDFNGDRHHHVRHHHHHHDFVPVADILPVIDVPPVLIAQPNDQYFDGGPRIIRTGRPILTSGPRVFTSVQVDNPCVDKVLKATTAISACINGKVHIKGTEYFYCRTNGTTESKPYSYQVVPPQDCNGNAAIQMEYLPQGWKKAAYGDGGCTDTGRTIVQYSPEGGYWMKITWQIWKCRDANGNDVERLGTTTIRESTMVPLTEDPPVKAGDYTPPANM